MSERKRTDWSYRTKMFNMKVAVKAFPISADDFPKYCRLLETVRQKQDFTASIVMEVSEDYNQILMSYTGEAYYLEILYPMDAYGWDHPLILANDSLTAEEAEGVLRSLLVDGTDQTEIITNHFHEISSSIYERKS